METDPTKVKPTKVKPTLFVINNNGDPVLWYLKDLVQNSIGEIDKVRGFDGGWERWMQIEFARQLNAKLQANIITEERVWDSVEEIDLWLPKRNETSLWNIGVELKCRSALATSFRSTWQADLWKITSGTSIARGNSRLYAIGLTTEKSDTEKDYEQVTNQSTKNVIPLYYDPVVPGKLWMLYAEAAHPV